MTILPLKNTPHTTTQMALPLCPKSEQPVGNFHHPPELEAQENTLSVFWRGWKHRRTHSGCVLEGFGGLMV